MRVRPKHIVVLFDTYRSLCVMESFPIYLVMSSPLMIASTVVMALPLGTSTLSDPVPDRDRDSDRGRMLRVLER